MWQSACSSSNFALIFLLTSKKWLTCNFSLRYLYVFWKMVNKNTQTYQEEVLILILHQILVTNLQGIFVAARGENLKSDLGSLRVNQYFSGLSVDQYLTTYSPIFFIHHPVNSYSLVNAILFIRMAFCLSSSLLAYGGFGVVLRCTMPFCLHYS